MNTPKATPPNEELYNQLTILSEEFLKTYLGKFKQHQIERLLSFNKIIEKNNDSLKKIDEKNLDLWEPIIESLSELNLWVDFKDYPEFKKSMVDECTNTFDSFISGLPLFQIDVWEDSFYLSKNISSSPAIFLFKRIKRVKRSAKKYLLKLFNVFRKDKKEILSESHIVKTRQFAAYFYQVPFMQFVDEVTDKMLALSSDQLNELHILMRNYMASVLMTESEETKWVDYQHDSLRLRIINAGEMLVSGCSWQEQLDTFKKSIIDSFDQWKESLQKDFVEKSHYTGTWILPHHRYGKKKTENLTRKNSLNFSQRMSLWQSHYEGESLDWSHEYALNKRQISVIYDTMNTLDVISGKIETQILPKCTDAIGLLTRTGKQLESLKTDQDWEIKRSIIRENRVVVKTFRQELIPAIAHKFLGVRIGHDINQILLNVKDSIDNLADSHTVFKKRDTGIPPSSETSKIPIKDLFREELLVKLESVLDVFEQQLRVELDEIINTMSEVRESVEFNIDTSFALLEKEDYTEEALVMVTDGLERSAVKLTAIKEKIEVIPEKIKDELGKIAFQWIMNIHNLLDNEKIIAMKLTLTKARASSRLKLIGSSVKKWTRKNISGLLSRVKKIHVLSIETYRKIKAYAGFSVMEDDVQIQFTQFLIETQQTLDSLPFVYQQLFQIEPLTDSRLFYGRENELESLTEDIKSWEKELSPILTAIVGEKGSGKTTLVNLLEQSLSDKVPVHICSFSETVRSTGEILSVFSILSPNKSFDSMEELEYFLSESQEPAVIVVENIHNFFIKSMDGFDQLEFFLGLMYRTRKKILWVCSCALYSWEYLDKTINISKAFTKVLMLKPFSEEQIGEMILARHRMTGYQLKFKETGNKSLPKKIRKNTLEKEKQEYLKKEFFSQIQRVASGNISVAILFWLRSIKSILEHELQIAPQAEFNVKFLSQLNTEDLFTLGAVAQHELISTEDHSIIFRQDERKSFLTLNALFRMGILQQSDSYYRIHPFLYRHVIRFLKLQNILH